MPKQLLGYLLFVNNTACCHATQGAKVTHTYCLLLHRQGAGNAAAKACVATVADPHFVRQNVVSVNATLVDEHKPLRYIPYFIKYSVHFFTWKMMLKYFLSTILGR